MQQTQLSLVLKKILILGAPILVALVGWFVYYATTFHIVSTTPATDSVATITPSLTINFSQPVVASSFKYSTQPQFTSAPEIHGKTVNFKLKTPLDLGKTYTITIVSVTNQKGKVLQNVVLRFTPQTIAFGDLPEYEQTEILHNQANAPSRQSSVFFNTDSLLDHGLSSQQAEFYQQAIRSYATSQKITLTGVVIDPASIAKAPLDGSGTFSVGFKVVINKNTYDARMAYSGLAQTEVFLYNPGSTNPFYDSGVLGASQ